MVMMVMVMNMMTSSFLASFGISGLAKHRDRQRKSQAPSRRRAHFCCDDAALPGKVQGILHTRAHGNHETKGSGLRRMVQMMAPETSHTTDH